MVMGHMLTGRIITFTGYVQMQPPMEHSDSDTSSPPWRRQNETQATSAERPQGKAVKIRCRDYKKVAGRARALWALETRRSDGFRVKIGAGPGVPTRPPSHVWYNGTPALCEACGLSAPA